MLDTRTSSPGTVPAVPPADLSPAAGDVAAYRHDSVRPNPGRELQAERPTTPTFSFRHRMRASLARLDDAWRLPTRSELAVAFAGFAALLAAGLIYHVLAR